MDLFCGEVGVCVWGGGLQWSKLFYVQGKGKDNNTERINK